MTGSTVLAQSDIIKSFVIETDTSDFKWEAVFIQVAEDEHEHLIAFESRHFISAERNYVTHKQKLLTIKEFLQKWQYYIKNETQTLV